MAWVCQPCGNKPFSSLKALYRHQRSTETHRNTAPHIEPKYVCPDCGKSFTRAYDRRRHERQRNVNGRLLPASCRRHVNIPSKSKKRRICSPNDVDNELDVSCLRSLVIRSRTLAEPKPWTCGVCHNRFAIDNCALIYDHINQHFTEPIGSNRCDQCEINFCHEADLRRHQQSANRDRKCGFRFFHVDDCTGHHAPSNDHRSMLDILRHWEQYQLQSYIASIEILRKKTLGAIYTRSESSSACRACYILRFFHDQFPAQHKELYSTHLKSHQETTELLNFRKQHITALETQNLINTLTGRYRRASSEDPASYATRSSHRMGDEKTLNKQKLHFEVSTITDADFVDPSYLANPLQGMLHSAACTGDWTTVQQCVWNGADIHGVDLGGRTALHWAAASGSTTTLELVLEHGGDFRAKDVHEETPLLVAVAHQRIGCVELLLQRQKEDGHLDAMGDELILTAIRSGDADVVKLLIRYGCDIDLRDWFGQTPLLLACRDGKLKVVRTLCELGADVEGCDESGRTPLMSAVDTRNFEVARELLRQGAIASSDTVALAVRRGADVDLTGLLAMASNLA